MVPIVERSFKKASGASIEIDQNLPNGMSAPYNQCVLATLAGLSSGFHPCFKYKVSASLGRGLFSTAGLADRLGNVQRNTDVWATTA